MAENPRLGGVRIGVGARARRALLTGTDEPSERVVTLDESNGSPTQPVAQLPTWYTTRRGKLDKDGDEDRDKEAALARRPCRTQAKKMFQLTGDARMYAAWKIYDDTDDQDEPTAPRGEPLQEEYVPGLAQLLRGTSSYDALEPFSEVALGRATPTDDADPVELARLFQRGCKASEITDEDIEDHPVDCGEGPHPSGYSERKDATERKRRKSREAKSRKQRQEPDWVLDDVDGVDGVDGRDRPSAAVKRTMRGPTTARSRSQPRRRRW